VALGTLVGASTYRFLSERFNWFGARLRQVQSYLRERREP
jgi:hypothetical protein